VPLCGYDVWRISVTQRLPPEDFVVPIDQDEPRSDSFRLAAAGPPTALMLDKQGQLKVNHPCVFLVRLPGGHDRCGIYPDRPVVCQAYPMVLAPNGVALRDAPLCPPDSWSDDELGKRSWRLAVLRVTMQFDLYAEVVARWNLHVDAAGASRQFALADYLSYLVNVYDRLAALDRELGDEAIGRATLTWGYVPDPSRSTLRLADIPWSAYFSHVRDVVDTFYPEIPPLSRPG
jgi:Fe-S-cluster containining protein